MKITINNVSTENEGTSSPWWVIIDPKQNFRTDKEGVNHIAHMITGPFFSREAAQNYLSGRRYNFGPNATVYCHSGYWSSEYEGAYHRGERNIGEAIHSEHK